MDAQIEPKIISRKRNLLSIIVSVVALLLSGCVPSGNDVKPNSNNTNENVVWTISGKKDSALQAEYELTYAATKFDKWYCKKRRGDTIAPKVIRKSFDVDDGNYTVKIPIDLLDPNDECAMEFKTLNLIVKRKSDDDHYNRFPIAGEYPYWKQRWQKKWQGNWATSIYNGRKYGAGSPNSFFSKYYNIPYAYRSNKKYFSLAKTTVFNCFTFHFDDDSKYVDFMCLMDVSAKSYSYQRCQKNSIKRPNECGTVHNPEFGFERLVDQNFTVNLYKDNNRSLKWNSNLKKLENDAFQE